MPTQTDIAHVLEGLWFLTTRQREGILARTQQLPEEGKREALAALMHAKERQDEHLHEALRKNPALEQELDDVLRTTIKGMEGGVEHEERQAADALFDDPS